MKLTILQIDEVEPAPEHAGPVTVTGLRSSRLMSPRDHSLFLCIAEVDAGATLTWPAHHADEALYVFSGELDVDGHRCPAGGAVIVESDVPARVTATTPSRIGHFGSWDPAPPPGPTGAPAAEGHGVHVVGPRGIAAFGDPETVGARFFGDARCDTCRLSLFEVTRAHPRAGRPHSHSADEIIYILDGTMHLGANELHGGAALSIPGQVRYAEGSGDDGCVFLNFRREVSDRTDFVKGQPPVTTLEQAGASPDLRREDDVVDVLFA